MDIKKLNEELEKFLTINEISNNLVKNVARKRYIDTQIPQYTGDKELFKDADDKWDRFNDLAKQRRQRLNANKKEPKRARFVTLFKELTQGFNIETILHNLKDSDIYMNYLKTKIQGKSEEEQLDIIANECFEFDVPLQYFDYNIDNLPEEDLEWLHSNWK